ncbi:MAG: RdgB/HAM1 family non-canonical purine NTP pyrophosphatase [Proteobacteria bacterium]|nr:RdgB/HAM1 family non-canonical purine NTP pyrophosphatase [Pseudomonadota bacterium]
MTNKIILASNNPGKIREIQSLLSGLAIEILPQALFTQEEADETGLTFLENALIKARHAAKLSGLPAIADDSGLEVDALKGAPGVYSARYAGPHATDDDNNAKLLKEMASVEDGKRTARFRCVMVFVRNAEDDNPLIAEASWEGRILRETRGNNGFGYDPLFFVPDQGCASAELPPDVKNRLSHRGQALRTLGARLTSLGVKNASVK